MTENLVEVEGLSRSFGEKLALDNLNFEAKPGHVYGLVGTNGAGKTTLIKHLLGLYRSNSGSVRIFGLDPAKKPALVLGRIGYLSEDRELPDWMSIEELMRFSQAYHPNWDNAYANELLDTFNLDVSKKIKDLSKGMRAQAGLIAAVAHRPDLLILDEPSSGLDVVVREDILNTIIRTVSDDGRTVIFSSHLLEEVERMSDYITIIHAGRKQLEGSVEELRESFRHSSIKFSEQLDMAPILSDTLSVEGHGRFWQTIHSGSVEKLSESVRRLNGEVLDSRNATLQEIFLAGVNRDRSKLEAA